MIPIKVTHPNHPLDATAEAVKCLARAGVHNRINGDRISILDPAQLERALEVLKAGGFVVSFDGHADYSN